MKQQSKEQISWYVTGYFRCKFIREYVKTKKCNQSMQWSNQSTTGFSAFLSFTDFNIQM